MARLRPSLETTMMHLATAVAQRSCCGRRRVGCVITDLNMEQIAYGYNGGAKGGINGCRRTTAGSCGCVHAEQNAIAKSRIDGDKLAFITTSPCEGCATLLVNHGVIRVYYRETYRDAAPGFAILTECNVEYKEL